MFGYNVFISCITLSISPQNFTICIQCKSLGSGFQYYKTLDSRKIFIQQVILKVHFCPLFRLSETLKIFNVREGPLQFLYFATGWMSKNPKGRAISVQLLGFLGTVEENTRHFEVLLLILSLRYGTDLGRSWLVLIRFQCSSKVETKTNQRTQKFQIRGAFMPEPPDTTLYEDNQAKRISSKCAFHYNLFNDFPFSC